MFVFKAMLGCGTCQESRQEGLNEGMDGMDAVAMHKINCCR
jgi:hypothetical protein